MGNTLYISILRAVAPVALGSVSTKGVIGMSPGGNHLYIAIYSVERMKTSNAYLADIMSQGPYK